MQIIDGRKLAKRVKDGIAQEIFLLGQHPTLAIILVGNRPDSELYVKLKLEEAAKVGIDASLYRLNEDASIKELNDAINFLNQDPQTDAILVHLPLPEQFDADQIIQLINPAKDVDGFHQENLKHLAEIDNPTRLLPPVYLTVLNSLGATGIDLAGRHTVVVAKEGIFGQKLVELLNALGARAKLVLPSEPELANLTKPADIIITAVGQAGLISSEHVKPDATLIDIGISQDEDGKTVGDLDWPHIQEAAWATPVPGGIGPQTVAFALKNTLDCYYKQHKND